MLLAPLVARVTPAKAIAIADVGSLPVPDVAPVTVIEYYYIFSPASAVVLHWSNINPDPVMVPAWFYPWPGPSGFSRAPLPWVTSCAVPLPAGADSEFCIVENI